FETLLTAGPAIVAGLLPEAIYEALRVGAERLLRTDHCIVLKAGRGEGGATAWTIAAGAARTPFNTSLGERAVAAGHPARARGAQRGGGIETGEERVPRQHQPRDPNAAGLDPGLRRPARDDELQRDGAARVPGHHPAERRPAPRAGERHPRPLEDRGGEADR